MDSMFLSTNTTICVISQSIFINISPYYTSYFTGSLHAR